MSNPSITADKTPWYQWDTGLTVNVSGGEMNECHFANRKQGTAYVQAVINGVARVPDELLQVAAPIKAYGYVSDGAGGQTYIEETFDVIARNIPADYTYTKTAQKTIRDAEEARDEAVQAANDAKASELAADDSAVEASNSAQSAGESASAAATSASNAAKSAGEAAKSASDAKSAAGKAVEDASAQLKTYTDNAKTSADNAATSASNAADAASAASGSASAAEQSATDASNAKAAAQTAKAGAETAASNAATSASNAESSATAAAKSASDAAASVGAINVIAPKTVDVSASSEVDGSVSVGAGSVAKNENEFSIGNDTLTREITHVSAPTADTSASTKKYTDDNDSKTLIEAKKYTDENASNALVGTVSGKLLHVDDAWHGKPLGLTIDGAYKQDGTPSMDNPVPIQVIENPVLILTGKNLLNLSLLMAGYAIEPSTGYIYPTSSGKWFSTREFTEFPGVNKEFVASGCKKGEKSSFFFYDYDKKYTGKYEYTTNESISFTVPSNTKFIRTEVFDGDYALKNTIIEVEPANATYAPYVSASLKITLPEEHPYLAALPDGTHDEIVIDKDGNASLVAWVQKVILNKWVQSSDSYYVNDLQSKWVTESAITSIGIATSYSSNNAGKIWFGNAKQVVAYTPRDGDTLDSINAIGILGYFSQEPVTYSLGKLDIPALPETISNVWTYAELTTDMSMTYKRDINVAFDNLVQAVVAAAAGE